MVRLYRLVFLPFILMLHVASNAVHFLKDHFKAELKQLPKHWRTAQEVPKPESQAMAAVEQPLEKPSEEPFNLRAFMKETTYLERYLLLHRHLYHLYIHDTKLPSFLAEEWDKKINACFVAIDESVETRSKVDQDKARELIHQSMKDMDELMRGPIHDNVVKRIDDFEKSRK